MNNVFNLFTKGINNANNLKNTFISIDSITTKAIDLGDGYRSIIVQVVSVFDYFIHELVLKGMIESFHGTRVKTPQYEKFPIPIALISQNPSDLELQFINFIREKHSWLSFQDPDKVADAIRLISSKRLWECVGNELGISAKDAKQKLKLIVTRRNQIAHEADMSITYFGQKNPLTLTDVDYCISSIQDIGTAIYKIITT